MSAKIGLGNPASEIVDLVRRHAALCHVQDQQILPLILGLSLSDEEAPMYYRVVRSLDRSACAVYGGRQGLCMLLQKWESGDVGALELDLTPLAGGSL